MVTTVNVAGKAVAVVKFNPIVVNIVTGGVMFVLLLTFGGVFVPTAPTMAARNSMKRPGNAGMQVCP